ncbi:MAG: hypothetical protein ACLUNQ_00990 [Oscillospiraceae bacterium]
MMQLQSQVMDAFNDTRLGTTLEVLCDGFDPRPWPMWAAAMPKVPASTA